MRGKFTVKWIIHCNYQYPPDCQWSLNSVISVTILAAAVTLVGSCWCIFVRSWMLCCQLTCSQAISALLTRGMAKGLEQWLRFIGDKHTSKTFNPPGRELRDLYWWKNACWNTVISLTLYWSLADIYPLLWYGNKSTTCQLCLYFLPVLYVPFLAQSHSAPSTIFLSHHYSRIAHVSQFLSKPLCCWHFCEPYIGQPQNIFAHQRSGLIKCGTNKTLCLIDLCLALTSWTYCYPAKCEIML